MNDAQQKEAARKFVSYWKDKGYEKGKVNHSGFLCFVMSMVWNILSNLLHLRNRCILRGYEEKSVNKILL